SGLHRDVVRRAAWIPKREVGEEEARHRALLDDIAGRSHYDGRDSCLLQMTGGQAHGLVTDRSEGDEDGRIHGVFPAEPQQLRRINLVRLSLAVLSRDPVEARRE